MDCSLNGVCNATTGACLCDAEWIGAACDALNLVPPDALVPAYPPPDAIANTTSWGGSVIEAHGRWVGFARLN